MADLSEKTRNILKQRWEYLFLGFHVFSRRYFCSQIFCPTNIKLTRSEGPLNNLKKQWFSKGFPYLN